MFRDAVKFEINQLFELQSHSRVGCLVGYVKEQLVPSPTCVPGTVTMTR